MENKHLPGNQELLKLFSQETFDKETALRIISEIPDLNQPILSVGGYSTTYLFEAQEYNNIEAVRLLLENGANPNLNIYELFNECALYDLHFSWYTAKKDLLKRLEIAKLFFAFGGDPNLYVEHETLYDHVIWEVFEKDIPHDYDYICEFFKILLAYGGGGGASSSPKPHFLEPIDKSRIQEYSIKILPYTNGRRNYFKGHLFNPDGIEIGVFE